MWLCAMTSLTCNKGRQRSCPTISATCIKGHPVVYPSPPPSIVSKVVCDVRKSANCGLSLFQTPTYVVSPVVGVLLTGTPNNRRSVI